MDGMLQGDDGLFMDITGEGLAHVKGILCGLAVIIDNLPIHTVSHAFIHVHCRLIADPDKQIHKIALLPSKNNY